MKLTIILTSFICFSYFSAFAQPVAGNGCMSKTSPYRVYQQAIASYGGLPTFKGYSAPYADWTTPADMAAYPCFTWVQTAADGCYIKTGSGNSASKYKLGNYGNFSGSSATVCPLDNYVWPLALLIGGIVFVRMRRNDLNFV